ncbi:MAG: zinc-ribbon domain-containing protein [Deltaproteobacteria bacterium]|nr:zinc-ribbon domain-containing protein [Deltaproteobacteria bacterium]
MIVTCEKCNTSFDLDDAMIQESGSEVKCSECEHVFQVYRPAPAEKTEPPPEPEGGAADSPQAEEPVEEEFDIEALGLEDEPEAEGPAEVKEEAAAEETLELAGGAAEEELDLEGFGFEDEPEAEEPAGVEEEAAAEETPEPAGGAAEEELDLENIGLEDEPEAEGPAEVEEEAVAEETPEPAGDAVVEELDLEAISRAVEEAAQEPETVSDEAPRAEEVLDFDLLEPEEETAAGEPDEQEIDFEGLSVDDEITPEEEVTIEEAPKPEPVKEEPLVQEFEAEEEPEPKIPMPPPKAAKALPAGKRVSKPLIIVLLLLLAGGALGGYVFMKGEVPFLKGGIPFLDKQKSAVVDPGNLHITLPDQKITTEFVENSTVGRLFVIKGIARNDYPEARNFIRVRGVLYAQDGKAVIDKKSYCGNVLSDSQLQTLDKTAMEMRMQNRFGVGKTNSNISTGTEVPFMVMFTDLPQDLGEFSVEVVSSAKAQ